MSEKKRVADLWRTLHDTLEAYRTLETYLNDNEYERVYDRMYEDLGEQGFEVLTWHRGEMYVNWYEGMYGVGTLSMEDMVVELQDLEQALTESRGDA